MSSSTASKPDFFRVEKVASHLRFNQKKLTAEISTGFVSNQNKKRQTSPTASLQPNKSTRPTEHRITFDGRDGTTMQQPPKKKKKNVVR